jgi:hypothetical protein
VAATLDELVGAGVLPPARRPDPEFLAWSAVHGLAELVLDGPLRSFDDEERHAIEQRLLKMIEQGL